MTAKEKIVQGAFSTSIAQIFVLFLNFVFVAVLARYLGDEGYGVYAFASSFAGLFLIISDLGLSSLTVRDVAADKEKTSQYMANITMIKLLVSLLYIAVVCVASLMIYKDIKLLFIIALMGVNSVLNNFYTYISVHYTAYEEFTKSAIILSIGRSITVALGLIGIFLSLSLAQIILLLITGNLIRIVIGAILFVRHVYKPKLIVTPRIWRTLVVSAIPFCVAIFAISVYMNIGNVFLGSLMGSKPVGWFNAARRLVLVVAFVPGVLNSVLLPILSRQYAAKNDVFKRTYQEGIRYLTILSIPLAVGSILLARPIVNSVFGTDFRNGAIALQIMALAIPLNWITYTLSTALVGAKREIKSMIIVILQASVITAFSIPLIQLYSYIGLAIAFLISDASAFILSSYYSGKYLQGLRLSFLPKILGATIVMGVLIFILRNFLNSSIKALIIETIASIAIYFTFLLATGAIKKSEVKSFFKAIKGVKW